MQNTFDIYIYNLVIICCRISTKNCVIELLTSKRDLTNSANTYKTWKSVIPNRT